MPEVSGPPHAWSQAALSVSRSKVATGMVRQPGVGEVAWQPGAAGDAQQMQHERTGHVSGAGQVAGRGHVSHLGQDFFFFLFLLAWAALSPSRVVRLATLRIPIALTTPRRVRALRERGRVSMRPASMDEPLGGDDRARGPIAS